LSGHEGPSSSALFQHSFPQPEELEVEDEEGAHDAEASGANGAAATTATTPPALQIPWGSKQKSDVVVGSEGEEFVDAPSEPEDETDLRVYTHEEGELDPDNTKITRRSSTKSFVTASSTQLTADEDDDEVQEDTPRGEGRGQAQASGLQVSTGQDEAGQKTLGKRPVSTVESHNTSNAGGVSVDAESTSSLLRKADTTKAPPSADNVDSKPPAKGILARVKRRSELGMSKSEPSNEGLVRKKSNLRNLVKFDIPEDSKRAKVHLKAKQAQMSISRAPTKLRRHKLRDGLVVKMERMLVRVDAADEVPDDFDENVNQKVTSRVKDKWREYMIVCRHSHSDNADFVLQLYKTRVSARCPTRIHFLCVKLISSIGHPRNRAARCWKKSCLRDTAWAQDQQSQSLLLAGQVDSRLESRKTRQSHLHHASSDCFKCR
jgi:hypothetical protein